ncbi:hypothetical protein PHMEG_0007309 [Phytophthora megakarya]|uniref:Uncharacterized protein n=1 Tax=Phytophthora megakarya TaxID=4795 RepID=A0A225WN60_9STRA|nr:hypothetical protein PHMEG_0007309 [Phytophthora megakarya]
MCDATSVQVAESLDQFVITMEGWKGFPPARPEPKIPTEVIACILIRNGKEVCLHYLSVRDCNSEEPEKCMYQNRAHFTPTSIPPKLRQYITSRLGASASSHQRRKCVRVVRGTHGPDKVLDRSG